jgi:predicted flap endonuclease-1-like 5' DNA nuclease
MAALLSLNIKINHKQDKEKKMSNTISDIEGIGSAFAAKLRKANVRSVQALLKQGGSKTGRNNLAQKTGIDETLILKWVNMADLYRVKGIGSEYSELLEKAGVDTVKELKNRKAQNLYEKMKTVNSSGRPLVRLVPGLKRVESWIEQAKKLDPKVTY